MRPVSGQIVLSSRGQVPSRLRVAVRLGRREARRLVVGVREGVVVRQVAAHTGGWRVVVVPVVALGAFVAVACAPLS